MTVIVQPDLMQQLSLQGDVHLLVLFSSRAVVREAEIARSNLGRVLHVIPFTGSDIEAAIRCRPGSRILC